MQIFVRHCFFSNASQNKKRPDNFDRQELLNKLVASLSNNDTLTVVLDDAHRKLGELHFTEMLECNRIIIKGGTEASSFAALLKHIQSLKLHDDEIVVFLEDDYLVKTGWQHAIKAALDIADYATGYDHPDKYDASMYHDLVSKLYLINGVHLRTTPSTTNSYACKVKTLKHDWLVHEQYSNPQLFQITNDHAKFLHLWTIYRNRPCLVSTLPAFWSHEEKNMQCLLD